MTTKELNKIEGGALRQISAWMLVGAGISFIIGVINGVVRPYSCGSSK